MPYWVATFVFVVAIVLTVLSYLIDKYDTYKDN